MKLMCAVVLTIAVCITGCSTTSDQDDMSEINAMLVSGATACNEMCAVNPWVEEYAFKAGGGSPLFFVGKVESSCICSAAKRQ